MYTAAQTSNHYENSCRRTGYGSSKHCRRCCGRTMSSTLHTAEPLVAVQQGNKGIKRITDQLRYEGPEKGTQARYATRTHSRKDGRHSLVYKFTGQGGHKDGRHLVVSSMDESTCGQPNAQGRRKMSLFRFLPNGVQEWDKEGQRVFTVSSTSARVTGQLV